MKGISAVLATVLIVVITVAIIGLAYGWATGLFQVTSEATEEQVGGVTDKMQKSVNIIAATCTNISLYDIDIRFSIKNTGTSDISSGEMTAFVNEMNIDTFFSAGQRGISVSGLDEGAVKEFSYKARIYLEEPTTMKLKVDAPAGAVEETITCPQTEFTLEAGIIDGIEKPPIELPPIDGGGDK